MDTLKVSNFIQHAIDHGYRIPFISLPPPFLAKNNTSSTQHPIFVDRVIKQLILQGCVTAVPSEPYCCNPLSVATSGGKLRLVLDLRHVNPYVRLQQFRHEDLRTLAEIFEKGDFFFTFDLTSGYHHISIHPDSIGYLGFQWTFNSGRHRFFVFNVLPFGLNCASHIFTKVLRPLVEKWRWEGTKAILYIDDGINGRSSYKEAKIAGQRVAHDLREAGFICNEAKCEWKPVQEGRCLGMIVNTRDMTFTVPPEKVQQLKGDVTNLFQNKEDDSKIARVYRRNIIITELSSRAFNAASDESDVRRHRKMHRMALPARNERGHGS